MKYRQIGNGGAFNYKMTNSSFVIWNNDEYMLFDCGYNVYTKLRRLDEDINENFDIKKLKNVYISHLDDDHVGSLKTLIYYQYFVNDIILNIYADYNITKDLTELLKDIDGYFENGKKVKSSLFTITCLNSSEYTLINNINVKTTKTNHHVPCYGAIFKGPDSYLYITGDSKVLFDIRLNIERLTESGKKFKVFHDFSNWDEPSKQVHACLTEINEAYPQKVIDVCEWYHNDADFDNRWKIV